MSQATSIEWTDFSVNPIRARVIEDGRVGHYCEKVSPGCANCYASRWQGRFGALPYDVRNRDKVELFLDESKLAEILRRRKPTKYFICDMTDLFFEGHPDEWIDKIFATMALAPQHTFQILTKRPERMKRYLEYKDGLGSDRCAYVGEAGLRLGGDYNLSEFVGQGGNWPLKNVWLGVSCEDQKTADQRIPALLVTPAHVRWISAGPLLGPVDLSNIDCEHTARIDALAGRYGVAVPLAGKCRKLDWVVVGGESGPGARGFKLTWAYDILRQCSDAGVACFVKQLGSRPISSMVNLKRPNGIEEDRVFLQDRKGGDMSEWPEDLRVREFPKQP